MPHVIEPAATGRSKCRGCGQRIDAGVLRFGESVPNFFAGEGETTHWHHLDCGAYKRAASFVEALDATTDPAGEAERLREDAKRGVEHERLQRINGAERDPSGRAQCRSCRTAIAKGSWRITLVFYEEGRFSPSGYVHPACARAYFETIDIVSRIKRFATGLGEPDLDEIAEQMQGPPPAV